MNEIFYKADVQFFYKTFAKLLKVTSFKDNLFNWKYLVNITFTKPLLNLNDPI